MLILTLYTESRRRTRSSFNRNWPDILIRLDLKCAHPNIYFTCYDRSFIMLVGGFTGTNLSLPEHPCHDPHTLPHFVICCIKLLMSGSDDKRLVLYDVRSSQAGKPGGGPVATFSGHSSWVLSTAISPDGRLALSGYVYPHLHVISTPT